MSCNTLSQSQWKRNHERRSMRRVSVGGWSKWVKGTGRMRERLWDGDWLIFEVQKTDEQEKKKEPHESRAENRVRQSLSLSLFPCVCERVSEGAPWDTAVLFWWQRSVAGWMCFICCTPRLIKCEGSRCPWCRAGHSRGHGFFVLPCPNYGAVNTHPGVRQ